ncbi:hypothetical protein [Streptomyces pseudovenezuelae]|uniref:PknH-like extracellular domain-containing protein n=1 Tax=Streptomyces pseudovenezuelae TaxID=67350 RepID=A0ABT6LF55_9ACTN|nr:hypothetical protein [Streptomyces pseudovenezuelae]MDH6214935.1 hypothetical protein [Streptomyces pseudovenezuelae]
MPRPPARVLVASALSAGTLLTASACISTPPQAHAPLPTIPSSAAPSAPAAATTPRGLTAAQAQAALVTEADLGDPWAPTQGAATWRDALLKATTDAPDCRRLLDALYADDLFGKDARPRAATGLDDTMDEAQLRYQVLALPPADVDRTLTWLKSLPKKCSRFTAVTERGTVQTVQVTEAALPEVGDTRQGLRVTLTSATPEGDPTVLTLDVAAARTGDDTIAVTNGGLGEVSPDITNATLEVGAQRLADVRKQGRAQV